MQEVKRSKRAKAKDIAPALADIPVGAPTQIEVYAEQRAKFLAAIAAGYSATAGAKLAGVHYTQPYHWRAADQAFAEAWAAAYEAGTHAFEDEARRRAIQGTQRPVYQAGKLVGHETVYSDQLLIQHLSKRSAEWRQAKAQIEITSSGTAPAQVDSLRQRIMGKLLALSGGRTIEGKVD